MRKLFLPSVISVAILLSGLQGQTPRSNTVPAKTKGEQAIPSTEMFSFSNCVVDSGNIYGLFVGTALIRVNREDGKYPQTLVVTNTQIGSFAVDGNDIYYTSQNKLEHAGNDLTRSPKGELRKIDLTDGSIKTLLKEFDYPDDRFIGTDATHIYFLGGSKKEGILVLRIAKGGGEPERVTSNLAHPEGFAVDDKNIYWCDYYNNSVRKVAKTGGEQTVLFDGNRSETLAVPVLMASDEGYLYMMGQRGDIYKIDKESGKTTLLYANGAIDFSTRTISVDKDYVYWGVGNRIMRMSKNGGNPTTVSLRPSPPDCVVVDDKYVYWAEPRKALMKLAK